MLQTIISNELVKRTGRTATTAEQNAAYLYISANLGDKPTFETLKTTMDDYIAEAYQQCEICGDFCPRDEIIEVRNRFICGCNACSHIVHDEYNEWIKKCIHRELSEQ